MPTRRRTRGLGSRVRVTRDVKRIVPKKVPLVPRPARWWREPLPATKLADVGPDEASFLIAQERLLKTEQLKEQLRTLRRYSNAFGAAQGFPLQTTKLIRLPDAKLKRLKRAYQALQRAQSQPYVEFTARTPKQKTAGRQRAGEILPQQKRFLIHHGDARLARADWIDGEIQITTTVKGGEIYERIYLFRKRARSWHSVVVQTQALMKRGMRTGNYKILNSLYGPIGELVSLDKLIDSLEQFFSTYNRWLAGTILGWVWMGTSLDVARKRQRRQKTQAERFQDQRRLLLQREQDLVKRRLGMKVPRRRKRGIRRPK
jgi:hypothetical protein